MENSISHAVRTIYIHFYYLIVCECVYRRTYLFICMYIGMSMLQHKCRSHKTTFWGWSSLCHMCERISSPLCASIYPSHESIFIYLTLFGFTLGLWAISILILVTQAVSGMVLFLEWALRQIKHYLVTLTRFLLPLTSILVSTFLFW